MDPLKMYFLVKMGIFHGYVSLPEGNHLFVKQLEISLRVEALDGNRFFSKKRKRAKRETDLIMSHYLVKGVKCCWGRFLFKGLKIFPSTHTWTMLLVYLHLHLIDPFEFGPFWYRGRSLTSLGSPWRGNKNRLTINGFFKVSMHS